MKRMLLVLLSALLVSTTVHAARIGGGAVIKDPPKGVYSGQYKYSYTVTYTDYQGNQQTGTAWEYVDVTYYTKQECDSALASASYWGAIITKSCTLQ